MILDFQNAYSGNSNVPEPTQVERWLEVARKTAEAAEDREVTVRVVSNTEIQQLNRDFRDQDKPTNVLSFPCDMPELPPGFDNSELADELSNQAFLGDIVIAADVVTREAEAQGKPSEAHWAHMTIHGLLHLLGYDHIDDDEAEAMEALETAILVAMGYAPPYKE